MNDREALKRSIDRLSPMGVRFVARMVDSLADPPRVQLPQSEPTWITAEPDWIEYFGLMISAHHGVTVEALGLTSLEIPRQVRRQDHGQTDPTLRVRHLRRMGATALTTSNGTGLAAGSNRPTQGMRRSSHMTAWSSRWTAAHPPPSTASRQGATGSGCPTV